MFPLTLAPREAMPERTHNERRAEERDDQRREIGQLIRGLVLFPLGTKPERDARIKDAWSSQKD
jgi:hypothetical protein